MPISTALGTSTSPARAGASPRHATVDPLTGELHLLTFATAPVPAACRACREVALTRTIRSIDDAPGRIRQLELTRDDVVLVADGFVGVTDASRRRHKGHLVRDRHRGAPHRGRVRRTARPSSCTPRAVPRPMDAGPSGGNRPLRGARRDAPQRSRRATGSTRRAQRFLWTVGAGTAHKHDLVTGGHRSHDFGDGRTPGELVFVADPDRSSTEDGGWLVGFVHDDVSTIRPSSSCSTREAIERPAVATVHIPRRVPDGAHGTWVSTRRSADLRGRSRCGRRPLTSTVSSVTTPHPHTSPRSSHARSSGHPVRRRVEPEPPEPVADPRGSRPRPSRHLHRPHHHQRRLAAARGRSQRELRRPAMGGRQLHDRLRRSPAHRRQPRRPVRTPACPRRRSRHLPGRIRRVRHWRHRRRC